jgi:hypothetical protein
MCAVQINTKGRNRGLPIMKPSVRKVIETRPNTTVGEVAKHEEIGSQKQKTEEIPTGVDVAIEKNTRNEDGATLQMEKERWFGQHFEILACAISHNFVALAIITH